MRHQFVHNKLFDFPRHKLILGISIALLTSFGWYAFFCVMREAMRIVFYWKTYHPTYYELLMLTDKEVLFYNFIFALIASLFGLSACFVFWFHRARRYNEDSIRYVRKSSIFTDITGLNAIFLHWFARIAIVFAMCGGILQAWCYFQLYPRWNFFWALLIVVLFLEMWKTIRKVAFRESRRWMLFSAVGIIVWSFILSRVQFVDYKGINNAYINSSITLKYQMEYPKSDYRRMLENRYLMMDVHLCFPHGVTMDSLPKVFLNQKECGFNQLQERIEEAFQPFSEDDFRKVTAVLHCDRKMPVKYVKMLKEHLACNGLRRIGYRIFPADMDNCCKSFPYVILLSLPPCPQPPVLDDCYSLLSVKLTSTGIYINEQLQDRHNMELYLREFMMNHPNYLISLDVDENCLYDDYIKIYSTFFMVVFNLRDEMSLEKYAIRYDDLMDEAQDEVVERYKLAIYEPK